MSSPGSGRSLSDSGAGPGSKPRPPATSALCDHPPRGGRLRPSARWGGARSDRQFSCDQPPGSQEPSWTIRGLSTCSLSSVSLRRCWLPGSSLSGQEWGVQGHGLAGQCWPEKAKRGGRAAETQGSLDRPLSCLRGAHAAHCGARAHTCAHTCSHLRCPSLPVPSRPEPAPGGHLGFLFSPLPL